jgi:hypothetical protein
MSLVFWEVLILYCVCMGPLLNKTKVKSYLFCMMERDIYGGHDALHWDRVKTSIIYFTLYSYDRPVMENALRLRLIHQN